METRRIGIILNGVTGRMGANQHLIRSILAIIRQGGVKVSDSLHLMPVPVLTGRNADKLKALAEQHGPEKWRCWCVTAPRRGRCAKPCRSAVCAASTCRSATVSLPHRRPRTCGA